MADEAAAVLVLASLLEPQTLDNATAIRFLRAKKGDPYAAAAMHGNHLAWRMAEAIDETLTEPALAEEQEAYLSRTFAPYLLDGYDRS